MRIAVIQFPGSNCERETMLALKRANLEPVEFLWNQSKDELATFEGYVIIGGFSYEDRSRSGAIAALDPIMQVIKAESEKGKPVLGICNGAQILVETGLVPGLENNKIGMSLTHNKRIRDGQVLGTGFYNTWIHMRLSDNYQRNAFTKTLTPKDVMRIPIAHAEGRFVIPEALLLEMREQGLGVFQYCDEQGKIVDEFPVNPNGSVDNIAAVSNKAGNVMAMMPHPERTPNGDAIFHSMREYIKSGHVDRVAPLNYYPRGVDIQPYQTQDRELIVDLIITDNHAVSVENALQHANIPVAVKRNVHWQIECDSEETFQKILESGVLYNNRKEKLLSLSCQRASSRHPGGVPGSRPEARWDDGDHKPQISFLVRPKEDMSGQEKKQLLEHHFDIKGLKSLHYGVLWHIHPRNTHDDLNKLSDQVINSHILFNPYAYDTYYY